MKKLALTSLVAFFAVSGAHAANIIDGNPLYRPGEGRFYSITGLETHSKNVNHQTLSEEFAYGVTDRLAIGVKTSLAQADWFDYMSWDAAGVGVNYRVYDNGAWKADLMAEYGVGPVWDDHRPFLDEDDTGYMWTFGARAGYVGDGFTIAGHVLFDYMNSESFNWDDEGVHLMRFGLDGQLALNDSWNLVAGAEYTAWIDEEMWEADMGSWDLTFGANYNLDETKFIGVYIAKEVQHVNDGEWEVQDGFGMGIKFGIDF